MKSYTVKEIAELLNTNPETVRRWIRDGKMQAVKTTRKDGNAITEDALKAFLKKSPKYARIAATSVPLLPVAGIALTVGSLVARLILEKYGNKRIDEIHLQPEAFRVQIEKSIADHDVTLQRKQLALEQLKNEIREERKAITDLQLLLDSVDLSSSENTDHQIDD